MTAIEQKEKVELLPPNLETARLPEFFPAVRKACKEPAAKFFYCFTEEGESKTGLDAYRGKRALQNCWPLMKQYENCMKKALSNDKPLQTTSTKQ